MSEKWYQELRVANRIKDSLGRQNCQIVEFIERKSECSYKIVAEKSSSLRIIVEVRGYPLEKIASYKGKGKTRSAAEINDQAKKWFADALLELSIERSKDPFKVEPIKVMAFGLPDLDIYRNLINDINYVRRKLALSCYFVKEDDSMEEVNPVNP